MSIRERFKRGWNAFKGRDPTEEFDSYSMYGSSGKPDRVSLSTATARSFLSAVYNRIAIDVSQVDIHCSKVSDDGKFDGFVDSPLDTALSRDANIDQTGRVLIRDLAISLFDEGAVAVVPTVTSVNPKHTDSYDIYELRIGQITQWYPRHVRVKIYNEDTGMKEEIKVEKRVAAIIENPFYPVMNAPNSTYRRLNRLLGDIDKLNSEAVSGKLDLIIQLPYAARSDLKKNQAEERRKELESQLVNSKYGIGYMDISEKIVQLNRPLANNLWEQAKDLMNQLLNQLGFSTHIFDGTANEEEMLTYYNSTIEPVLSAITEEMERKWISKTAYTQGKRIRYFRNPFKLVPVNNIADIADKFTRNEILTSNEIRGIVGMAPSNDPKADELINSNLNQSKEAQQDYGEEEYYDEEFQNE